MNALLQFEIEQFRGVIKKGICRRLPVPEVMVAEAEGDVILMASMLEVIVQYRISMTEPSAKLARTVELPQEPATWATASRELLDALHEAGRVTCDLTTRYALNRIQLLGTTGRIAASDGQCAYIRKGFRFPFETDLLVPSLSFFGISELKKLDAEVRTGSTDTYVVMRIGPWTVFLLIDKNGRFPVLSKLIPKATGATELRLSEDDALMLLARLKEFAAEHEETTINIPIQGPATVIVGESAHVKELSLVHSQITHGGPKSVTVHLNHLERGLRLGCRTIRCVGPDRPLALLGRKVTFLAVNIPIERNNGMKPTERREHPEEIDPLIEAEALRTALGVAHQRLSRLLVALKSIQKDKKTFTQVLTSLQSLKLR